MMLRNDPPGFVPGGIIFLFFNVKLCGRMMIRAPVVFGSLTNRVLFYIMIFKRASIMEFCARPMERGMFNQ